ncbi:MAG: type II toxin-antitoxin system VapC family toxin [Actinomycetota bacterium]|nr:type II toxin-antitoxin system VapC family toxin [Actinomycetota bacterium]
MDASIALANVLPDEESSLAYRVLDLLESESALAPTLWLYEVASALRIGQIRKRVDQEFADAVIAGVKELNIEFEHPDGVELLRLSRQTGLTVYDASYLALCLKHQLPLASLDRRLVSSARELGIEVLT